jgi:hypothetical protein
VLKSELQSVSWSGEAKYSYSLMKIKCMVLHSALAREMSSGRTITINCNKQFHQKRIMKKISAEIFWQTGRGLQRRVMA